VDKTLLNQVEEFFVSYNKQRGKKFRITGLHGPKRALKCLKKALNLYAKEAED
jgi:inorganic pyrophosphatase